MVNTYYWDPDTMSAAPGVRPSSNYSQEGTLEDYRAAVAEYKANQPQLSEPDWVGFNTEMFLDKDWSNYINPPMLMAAATSAALSRDVAQLQYCIELAYQTVGEPSEAARTRWNNLAERFHIGVTF